MGRKNKALFTPKKAKVAKAKRSEESSSEKKLRQEKIRLSTAASRKLTYLNQKHDILNEKCSSDDVNVHDMSSDVDFTTPAVPGSSVKTTISCTKSTVSNTASPTNNTPSSVSNTTEHFIGPMTSKCPHCQDARFPDEGLNCCHNGKVMLPITDYPHELQQLFVNQAFLKDIRIYNNLFAFASLGAQISPLPGFGPYCFRIHGQIYHRSGNLHPQDGNTRKYGQVYILDGTST